MRRTPLQVFAGALALLLPLAYSNALSVPGFMARFAVVPLEAAIGLPSLVALWRTSARRTAICASAFAAWVMVSLVANPARSNAFWGRMSFGTGALFVLAVIGCWAIGVRIGREGARLVEIAILAAAAINIGMIVIETRVDLSPVGLDLQAGRAPGLFGSPIYAGVFLAGVLWVVLVRLRTHPIASAGAAIAVVAAIQLTGTRSALLIVPVVVIGALRVVGIRATGLAVAAVIAGAVLGPVIGRSTGGVHTTGTTRVAAQGVTGGSTRLDTWISSAHAVTERPVVGWGPARFRVPTERRRTLAVAREGTEEIWTEGHNLVVEYAVTTGLVGAALLVAFIALVVRGAGLSSPLAGFGLVVLLLHLVEPQNVVNTPLALLALGAAAPVDDVVRPLPTIAWALGIIVAVGVGVTLIAGDVALRQAALDFRLRDARQARTLLPPRWPEPMLTTARIFVFRSKTEGSPALAATGRMWKERAAMAAPDDPSLWNGLAEDELDAALFDSAGRHFGDALTLNPWSARALNGLARVAIAEGRPAEAVPRLRRSLLANPNQPSIRKLLAEAEAEAQAGVSPSAP